MRDLFLMKSILAFGFISLLASAPANSQFVVDPALQTQVLSALGEGNGSFRSESLDGLRYLMAEEMPPSPACKASSKPATSTSCSSIATGLFPCSLSPHCANSPGLIWNRSRRLRTTQHDSTLLRSHFSPDALLHVPGGRLAHIQVTGKLAARQAFLGVHDQGDGAEPLL